VVVVDTARTRGAPAIGALDTPHKVSVRGHAFYGVGALARTRPRNQAEKSVYRIVALAALESGAMHQDERRTWLLVQDCWMPLTRYARTVPTRQTVRTRLARCRAPTQPGVITRGTSHSRWAVGLSSLTVSRVKGQIHCGVEHLYNEMLG
jgi:hypothetical protein